MSKLSIDLLLSLRSAGHYGLAPADLLTDMRRGRHAELTEPELLAALRELADASLVTVFTTALKARRWKITGLGESALQEERL